jgi:hypothetical protein
MTSDIVQKALRSLPNPTFHRTNLNLYAEDVVYMQQLFGRGWTEQARDIIHQELKSIKERSDLYWGDNEMERGEYMDMNDGK